MAVNRDIPKKRSEHLTSVAQRLISEHFEDLGWTPNLCIDATCGNGHDTQFLAKLGAQVLAFDIQSIALENTRATLTAISLLDKVTLIHSTHADMITHATEPVGPATRRS